MKTKFTSQDGTQTLTIVAAHGKRGWNVKASIKTGTGKGADKAVTGCRETFKAEAEAKSAFAKLVAEGTKRGWVEKVVTTRNAFSSIPEPKGKKAKAA